jgi:predicted ATP-binding protein involved in virulence
MSTKPFGSIVLCGDYKGKLQAIADALNAFDFAADGSFYVKDNRIAFSSSDHEGFPTVFAYQFDDRGDIENMSLKWLSENLCPLMTNGTMEIVVVAGDSEDAYLQRLTLRSDGQVDRAREEFNALEEAEWHKSDSERVRW